MIKELVNAETMKKQVLGASKQMGVWVEALH
jgi:ribosomal protein L11